MKKTIFLFYYFIGALVLLNAESTLKITPPQSKYDSSHDYFHKLLIKVLDITKEEYGDLEIIYSLKMQQGRSFIELKKGKKLDVYWAGSSMQREKEFNAVKIPLIKGLLGYRLFIINEDKKELFDKINTLKDLKKLKACQGTHWPDTKILENADISVVKNTNYELMFLQVQNNRCDYFPRGIHEVVSEISSRKSKYKKLMLYKKIILYYPFPMYFFVSKHNYKLSQRIEKGLLTLIKNGVFENHMKEHGVTKHLFPIDKWINVKIFKLKNPFLSPNTDFNNEKFWITNN